MNKKLLLVGFLLGAAFWMLLGAVDTRTNNIFQFEQTDKEIKYTIRASPTQTADFLELFKGPTNVFNINSNGLISVGLGFISGVTTNIYFLTSATTSNALLITNGIVFGIQ